jgi:hypothetical protein
LESKRDPARRGCLRVEVRLLTDTDGTIANSCFCIIPCSTVKGASVIPDCDIIGTPPVTNLKVVILRNMSLKIIQERVGLVRRQLQDTLREPVNELN